MYEYKIVELGFKRLGLKAMAFSELEEHQEIINKYAKEGWRLIQILPVKFGNAGYPTKFEIIFERKIENSN
ncbi:MAG: DUF4177 domain-containing protein [Gudongella sp.]|nr:DUF4177 domain-containing protein [Gudongella sp.]